jgi:hypothetical protein
MTIQPDRLTIHPVIKILSTEYKKVTTVENRAAKRKQKVSEKIFGRE